MSAVPAAARYRYSAVDARVAAGPSTGYPHHTASRALNGASPSMLVLVTRYIRSTQTQQVSKPASRSLLPARRSSGPCSILLVLHLTFTHCRPSCNSIARLRASNSLLLAPRKFTVRTFVYLRSEMPPRSTHAAKSKRKKKKLVSDRASSYKHYKNPTNSFSTILYA